MAPVETTPVPEYIVNLDLAPRERWQFLSGHVAAMDELLGCYLGDFEGAESLHEDVAMQITVQQMVFDNKTGEISLLRT